MVKVDMQEAKTHLSELVAAAERGETVLLCRGGEPIVQLRLVSSTRRRTETETRNLGAPVTRTEALTPLGPSDWADWQT